MSCSRRRTGRLSPTTLTRLERTGRTAGASCAGPRTSSWCAISPSSRCCRDLPHLLFSSPQRQASSLSPACNAPKHHYDTCFNHWLKSYLTLIAPPLSNPSDTPAGAKEREKRNKAIEEKKQELETNCGAAYKDYQDCLRVHHRLFRHSKASSDDLSLFVP